MNHLADVVVAGMSVTFFLLAFQAEPVTAALGYVFGTLLFVALINHLRGNRNV